MIRTLKTPIRAVSNGFFNSPSAESPLQNQVMTTSTWPAPYYKRIFKAYPTRRYIKREAVP